MMNSFLLTLCLIALTILASQTASSTELIASRASSTLSFCGIDKETGEEQNCLHKADVFGAADLASAPIAGSGAWAITFDFFNDGGTELVNISRNGSILSRTSINTAERIHTLAIDPLDGTFYGGTDDQLITLDPSSGEVKAIGVTSYPLDKGLAFTTFGTLYGVSEAHNLVIVDKQTGNTRLRAELDVTRIEDIAFDPKSGELFGIGYGGPYTLYQIDRRTFDVLPIGPSLFRPSGLAFVPVPEPSGALLLLIGLGILSMRFRRSR